jgi:hypothetical protein
MPKIADHTYDEALLSSKCMAGRHKECSGIVVIGIRALRRQCACQCHLTSEQSDTRSI